MKNLEIILKLAWRNVWRNKRRTILTLLTIVVGTQMIIVLNAFHKGSHDQMIEEAVSSNTGHIQIHEKNYWDIRTIDYAFQPDENLMKALNNNDRIAYFSKRIHADCLISYNNASAGAMIQGIDPDNEVYVSNFSTKILKGGRFIKPDDKTLIVIGEILARNIGAKVGSRITMISQGFDGSMAAEKLEIAGLLRSGDPEYDQGLIIMPIAQASETFSMMGYINSITVRLKSSGDTAGVKEYLKKSVDTKYEVLGWDELKPEMVQYILMDDIGGYVFSFILFMVVAFGVLNTIQMTIFERTRELGVMLAIGTRPGQVVSMVMTESLFISVLGIIGGLTLGFALSYYFYLNPIDISSYAEEMTMWGISATNTGLPADASPINGSLTAIFTLILGLFFSIFPARRAAGLKPIDAIRHL